MAFLLRTETGYRLCYGEPANPYVITASGSYFGADEYQEMCNEEKEVQASIEMDHNNFPIQGWADVCQNDLGIIISEDIAEYLLQGKTIEVDTFLEFESIKQC